MGLRLRDKKTEKWHKVAKQPSFNGDELMKLLLLFFEALVWIVRPGYSSQTWAIQPRFTQFIDFLCRAVFESKRIILMDSSRLTRLDCTVRSGFQNHASQIKGFFYALFCFSQRCLVCTNSMPFDLVCTNSYSLI